MNMKLADYLELDDCTYSRFARKIGVSSSTVQRWCMWDRTPSLRHMMAIENATKGKVKAKDFIPPVALTSPTGHTGQSS